MPYDQYDKIFRPDFQSLPPDSQLPQWIPMGEDESAGRSTGKFAELLKKRMMGGGASSGGGGIGSAMGGAKANSSSGGGASSL